MYKSWKELEVFKKSHTLTLEIYKTTASFPKSETYGIISQIRRTAYSVPINIIEGKSRKNTKEFMQFLNISNASLAEVRYFLLLSKDLRYIDEDSFFKLERQCEEISKMLNSFINSLRRKSNAN